MKNILFVTFLFIIGNAFSQQIKIKCTDFSVIKIDTFCLPKPPRNLILCFSNELDTFSIVVKKGISLNSVLDSTLILEEVRYISPYSGCGFYLYETDWYVDKNYCFPMRRKVYRIKSITSED